MKLKTYFWILISFLLVSTHVDAKPKYRRSSTLKSGRPSTQTPPKKPGVYQIKKRSSSRKDGKTLYVGETNNLQRRRREHQRSGKYNAKKHSFHWQKADGRSTSKTRRRDETRRIKKSTPPLNRNRGGGGRAAKRR